ncbi:alpha-galactosidase [Lactobacillus plantarum JDM1] [Lactiplantibacillus mudanjiangensis]|uniref:alpha-galactosidase n=1 Tax=Lactiplantibacillus mudanjiangensis TaxID=1296538 RepID=UPI00101597A1|nr:alpha-galactosidase [Lactiplantibacillus mudanjiangensis]VDG32075.1 alpha-galactosidase [Lactobacillus plantarum JDM1] [Lactiplantibacillus mudanjiangensis]
MALQHLTKTTDLIQVDDHQQVFHLQNNDISYVLGVETGDVLAHLYFGPRIEQYHGERQYPRIDRGFSGNLPQSLDRTYSKDDVPQEYAGNNTGDYRLPAAVIRAENGARTVDFRYQTYRVSDGKPDLTGLPQTYVEADNEAQTLTVLLSEATLNLQLELNYTIYRDRPVITRSARVINRGESAVNIEKLASMQLDLPTEPLEVISLPGSYARERQLTRQPIPRGLTQFESRRGGSSHHMNPFMALVTPQTTEFSGAALGVLLIYSGNHQLSLEKDAIGQTRVMAGINEYNFDWQLAPEQSFQTPEVAMVYSNTGLNGMSQSYHSLLRERVARGQYRNADRPILINNWEATYFDFDAGKIQQILDAAAPLGIEMFVLDDGWFGHRNDDNSSLGDWVVNRDKLPGGLSQIAAQTHAKKMRFGLWFEPENISEDSDLFRQHPDWALGVPNRGRTLSRNEYVLDFSNPLVVDNLYEQMTVVLDEVPVDYIKWDMNRNLTEVYSAALAPAQQGEVSHRYILGVYDLMERLTKRYPQILFEGCSGGGGRFDAGLLYYMPQSWPSDNNDPIERLKIQYGTSLVYPISSITAHVGTSPDELLGRSTSMDMRGAVAMSGTLGYELDASALSDADKQAVIGQIKFYKEHRHLIQYGTFYRLESPFTSNTVAWLFVSPDQSEALLYRFVVQGMVQPEPHITKLAGLKPQAQYLDTGSEQVYGGDELMNVGLYTTPVQTSDFMAQINYFKVLD